MLGVDDAEDLGIIIFNPEGMDTSKAYSVHTEKTSGAGETGQLSGTPNKLRKAGIKVQTSRPPTEEINEWEKQKTLQIVDRYVGLVFSDRVGCLQVDPVRLQYESKTTK